MKLQHLNPSAMPGPGDIGRRDPLDCDEDRPITVEDDRRMRAALAQAKSSAWRAMSDLDRITLRHEHDEDPALFDDLRVPLREAKETYRILNDSMKGEGNQDENRPRCCACGDDMPPGGLHKHWSGTYTCRDCWDGMAEDASDARRDDERMEK